MTGNGLGWGGKEGNGDWAMVIGVRGRVVVGLKAQRADKGKGPQQFLLMGWLSGEGQWDVEKSRLSSELSIPAERDAKIRNRAKVRKNRICKKRSLFSGIKKGLPTNTQNETNVTYACKGSVSFGRNAPMHFALQTSRATQKVGCAHT